LVGNLAGAGCAPFPVAAAAAACFFASAFCFAAAAAASSCVGSSLSSAPRMSKGLMVAMETAAGKVTPYSRVLVCGDWGTDPSGYNIRLPDRIVIALPRSRGEGATVSGFRRRRRRLR